MTAPNRSETIAWHALAGDEALKRLDSNPDGLTSLDAEFRLAEYGRNELKQTKARP